jgi:peptidoglycan LD-endopeptidase CwlK
MKTLKEIQQKLNSLGYGPLTVDGIQGPKTKLALIKFQMEKGLSGDGVVGPATEARLFGINAPVPVVKATEMRDKVSIAVVDKLHPKIRGLVKQGIIDAEAKLPITVAIRVVQGGRSFEYQHALYCQPWDKKDNDGDGKIDEADEKVTNADAGQSYHNFWLAIDFAILYDLDGNGNYEKLSWDMVKDHDRDGQADWMEVVAVFEKVPGCKWGGRWKSFKDNPHFEWSFGYSVSQLLAKVKAKQVDNNGYVTL